MKITIIDNDQNRAQWIAEATRALRTEFPGHEVTEVPTGYRDAGVTVRFDVAVSDGSVARFEEIWKDRSPGLFARTCRIEAESRGLV